MAAKRQMKSLSTWGGAHPRLQPEVWPVVSPSFSIPPGAKIFTIGSCFARNVERNLATLKMDLPTLAMRLPTEEWAADDNQFLNRYTPQTIWQDITVDRRICTNVVNGYDEAATERFAIELEDGNLIDTGFPLYVPVTRERFHERRSELFEVNRQMFSADTVTITLGLVESWQDTESGGLAAFDPAWAADAEAGRPVPAGTDRHDRLPALCGRGGRDRAPAEPGREDADHDLSGRDGAHLHGRGHHHRQHVLEVGAACGGDRGRRQARDDRLFP